MRDHVHTGFVAFAFAGFSAIVMIHILRAIAAQLDERMPAASKALGAFALAD